MADSMAKCDYKTLTDKLDEMEYQKVEVDVNLLEDAKIMQEKLKT